MNWGLFAKRIMKNAKMLKFEGLLAKLIGKKGKIYEIMVYLQNCWKKK